jgi:hypothetical protein
MVKSALLRYATLAGDRNMPCNGSLVKSVLHQSEYEVTMLRSQLSVLQHVYTLEEFICFVYPPVLV